MKKLYRSKLYGALFLLLLIFMTGVLGFKVLSGYSLIDAIYMTVITITTVGYGEVRPLGPLDKIFTSLFIIFSFFILGYVISVITEYPVGKVHLFLPFDKF